MKKKNQRLTKPVKAIATNQPLTNITMATARNKKPRNGMKGFSRSPGEGKTLGIKLPIAKPSNSIPTIWFSPIKNHLLNMGKEVLKPLYLGFIAL